MRQRLAFLAAFFLWLMPAAALAAEVTDVAFRFSPASGETLSWQVGEIETASLAGRQAGNVRWSQKLTITFGRELPEAFEAKLTVSSVRAEGGAADTLHYLLARAAADRPMDVIIDKAGYVRQVLNWPGVRSEMIAALPGLTDEKTVKLIARILDRLGPAEAGTAVARPLLLQSAGYGLVFKSDGSVAEFPDWQGGSAFIFPGRKVGTRILGKMDNLISAAWSLITDRAVAAEHVGGEVLSILNAAAKGDAAFAEAARDASALLATGGLGLGEDAGIVFDVSIRRVVRFQHRLILSVGAFRKEQTLLVDLLP